MEKNDRYAIVTNVIESLEKGGSFNQRDRLPSMWSLHWLQEISKNIK